MRRTALTVTMALAAFAASALSEDERLPSIKIADPREPLAIGSVLPADVEVSSAALNSMTDPDKPFAVVFWSSKCPVCRRYAAPLAALRKDFDGRAGVIAVLANDGETDAAENAFEDLTRVRPTVDPGREAARRLGVVVTPTVLVFDAGRVLRYRGPIDDDRRNRRRDTTDYVRVALESVLADRPVENAEPRAFGSSVRAARR